MIINALTPHPVPVKRPFLKILGYAFTPDPARLSPVPISLPNSTLHTLSWGASPRTHLEIQSTESRPGYPSKITGFSYSESIFILVLFDTNQ